MSPAMTLRLQAAVDGAEAHLRIMLDNYPSLAHDLRENPRSQNVVQTVAIDVLAALSEAWEESVETRLDIVTARLLAWQRIGAQ